MAKTIYLNTENLDRKKVIFLALRHDQISLGFHPLSSKEDQNYK
jgi:hypothetical protein